MKGVCRGLRLSFYLLVVSVTGNFASTGLGFSFYLFADGFYLVKKKKKKYYSTPLQLCHNYQYLYNNTSLLSKTSPLLKSVQNVVNCNESHIFFIFVSVCFWVFCISRLLARLQLPTNAAFFALLLLLAVVSFCICWCEWISHSFSWMCFLKVLFNIWCNYNRH